MKKVVLTIFVTISCLFILLSCQTSKLAPQITDKTSNEDIISIALEYGGVSLNVAKEKISKRGIEVEVASFLEKELLDKEASLSDTRLTNGINLYQYTKRGVSTKLLTKMLYSGRKLSNDLGWVMASNFPNEEIKNVVENYLTKKIEENNEKDLLNPFIARAIQKNRIISAYSVVRLGLFQITDNIVFAEACAELNPKQATKDFLEYLSKADLEDLRQLNQKSVNMQTASFVLQHMLKYPPEVSSSKIDVLFLYAVSRNNGLSDYAFVLLSKLYEKDKELFALKLSRLSEWIQICFVDQVREKINNSTRMFLLSLKEKTPYVSVVDEIQDLKL